MQRYDGINGKTQGDKKESTPAPKAINIDMFSETIILFKPILFLFGLSWCYFPIKNIIKSILSNVSLYGQGVLKNKDIWI